MEKQGGKSIKYGRLIRVMNESSSTVDNNFYIECLNISLPN